MNILFNSNFQNCFKDKNSPFGDSFNKRGKEHYIVHWFVKLLDTYVSLKDSQWPLAYKGSEKFCNKDPSVKLWEDQLLLYRHGFNNFNDRDCSIETFFPKYSYDICLWVCAYTLFSVLIAMSLEHKNYIPYYVRHSTQHINMLSVALPTRAWK
jgi:hypothetical protein